jgi:hypothetical protein
MNWIKGLYFKQIALVVALGIFMIGAVPVKSMAYVVESEIAPMERAADMDTALRVLESELVSQKLIRVGLTPDEVRDRLAELSDAELHQFARQIDSLYPGGGATGVIIALLVIAILVLVILKLTDHKIIIK